MTTYQLTVPETNLPSWTAVELDPGGEVSVKYQRLGADRFDRKKLAHVRVAGVDGLHVPGPRDVVPKVLISEGQYQVDGAGRISNARMRLVTKVKSLEMAYDMDLETTFTFVSRGTAVAARPVTVERKPVALTLDQTDFDQARRQAWKNAVKGKTVTSVIGDLKAARAEKKSSETLNSLYRLGLLMKLDDNATAEVAAQIRSGNFDPGVLSALGGAGTPLAQATLMAAANQMNLQPDIRLKAVHAVHSVEQPTAETVAAVDKLAAGDPDPQVKRDASYAKGTMIARLSKTNASAARDKVRELAAEWSPTAPPDEKRRILRALGNTAHEEALATLKLGLADPLPTVREAAARALHKIPGSEVEQLLSAVIVSTDKELVRYGALAAAPGRKFPLLSAAFQSVLRGDENGQVRTRVLQAIEIFLMNDPGNRDMIQIVESVAKNDADEDIRANATQLLKEAAEMLANSQNGV